MFNFDILLIIHVLCGGISLLLGLTVLTQRKGGRLHKLVGSIYFYTMLISSFTAMPMSWIHRNYFLLIVAIVTAYMLLSGRRYIKRKKVPAVFFDWVLSAVMAVAAIIFIVLGIISIVNGNTFGIVYMVFGLGGLFFVYQDYRNFTRRTLNSNFWLTTHLQRMIGSYIAALTAFLVVNNTMIPGAIAWLIPTIFLLPLILVWSGKYKAIKDVKTGKLPDRMMADKMLNSTQAELNDL